MEGLHVVHFKVFSDKANRALRVLFKELPLEGRPLRGAPSFYPSPFVPHKGEQVHFFGVAFTAGLACALSWFVQPQQS